MRTLISKFTVSLIAVLPLALAAQTGSQTLTFSVIQNSNWPVHMPLSMDIVLGDPGDDALTAQDTGDIASLGSYSLQVFPFTVSSDNNVITDVDARPALNGHKAIPVGFLSQNAATIQVQALLSTTDPHATLAGYVWLEQISTGKKASILNGAEFDILPNTTGTSDFILHIGPATGSVPTDANCYGNSFGTILVKGPGAAGFNYDLKSGATVLFSGFIAGYDTVFHNVVEGAYTATVNFNGMMLDSSDFSIVAPALNVADFTTDQPVYTLGEVVTITDLSVGGPHYEWRFGDGDSSALPGNQTHTYSAAGSYLITLMLTDTAGCMSMHTELITIDSVVPPAFHQYSSMPDRSSLESSETENATERRAQTYSINSGIVVSIAEPQATRVTIMSTNGAMISGSVQNDARATYAVPSPGIYILMLEYTDGTADAKTVYVQ